MDTPESDLIRHYRLKRLWLRVHIFNNSITYCKLAPRVVGMPMPRIRYGSTWNHMWEPGPLDISLVSNAYEHTAIDGNPIVYKDAPLESLTWRIILSPNPKQRISNDMWSCELPPPPPVYYSRILPEKLNSYYDDIHVTRDDLPALLHFYHGHLTKAYAEYVKLKRHMEEVAVSVINNDLTLENLRSESRQLWGIRQVPISPTPIPGYLYSKSISLELRRLSVMPKASNEDTMK